MPEQKTEDDRIFICNKCGDVECRLTTRTKKIFLDSSLCIFKVVDGAEWKEVPKEIAYPYVCTECGTQLAWMAVAVPGDYAKLQLMCPNCHRSLATINTYDSFLEMMKDRKG